MSKLTTRDFAEMPWVKSAAAEGCWSKKIYLYSDQNLGRDGKSSSYTTLYRFDPGAAYPPWRVVAGVVEIWVRSGTLQVNGEDVEQDKWVQLTPDEAAWTVGSVEGCEVLAIVRGDIAQTAFNQPRGTTQPT